MLTESVHQKTHCRICRHQLELNKRMAKSVYLTSVNHGQGSYLPPQNLVEWATTH